MTRLCKVCGGKEKNGSIIHAKIKTSPEGPEEDCPIMDRPIEEVLAEHQEERKPPGSKLPDLTLNEGVQRTHPLGGVYYPHFGNEDSQFD